MFWNIFSESALVVCMILAVASLAILIQGKDNQSTISGDE